MKIVMSLLADENRAFHTYLNAFRNQPPSSFYTLKWKKAIEWNKGEFPCVNWAAELVTPISFFPKSCSLYAPAKLRIILATQKWHWSWWVFPKDQLEIHLSINVKRIQITKNCKGYDLWFASFSISYLTRSCYDVSGMI